MYFPFSRQSIDFPFFSRFLLHLPLAVVSSIAGNTTTIGPYEIFVRDLVAVDGVDTNEIPLIDSNGCPTEMAIMTSISKFSKSSKKLRTTFEAFKFPASDTVQFRALITPCLSSCKPVQCTLLNAETGVNQEFVSYGRRRRRRRDDAHPFSHSFPPPSSGGRGITDTMYATLGTPDEETVRSARSSDDPSPDVVVVGAIRITENFAAFESGKQEDGGSGSRPPHDDAASVARDGDDDASSGGGGRTGNSWRLSSRSGSDSASASSSSSSSKLRPSGNEGRSRSQSTSRSLDDCSNMMGLIIACVIFLTGQSVLLLVWIYLYRMSGVYRSKFFASAFSLPSHSPSSCRSVLTNTHVTHSPMQHQQKVPTYGVLQSGSKSFPHCYSFPFALSPATGSQFQAPADPDRHVQSKITTTRTSMQSAVRSLAPVKPGTSALSSPSSSSRSSPSSHMVVPSSSLKVSDMMSKRSFNHP